MTEVLYDKNRKYVNNASRAFDLVWSLKDFSRLATATSSQSPLGHDSRRRHPPSSDPIFTHCSRPSTSGMLTQDLTSVVSIRQQTVDELQRFGCIGHVWTCMGVALTFSHRKFGCHIEFLIACDYSNTV